MTAQTTHWDAIVVGLGSAGAAAAALLSQAGLRVLGLDKRPLDKAGARWVNGVPAWCFLHARIDVPAPPEALGHGGPTRFRIFAEGAPAPVDVDSQPTLHVDMRGLVARLQGEARRAGAILRQGHLVSLRVHDDHCEVVWQGAQAPPCPATASLVVDATGLPCAVARNVPALHRPLAPEDTCSAAQYQHRVAHADAARAWFAAQGLAPGDTVAFTGLDGAFSTLTVTLHDDEVGLLTGSIPSQGHASGQAICDRFVREHTWVGERLWGGAGAIPLWDLHKRQGADRVALVGDTAGQMFAAHGSGVGMGILGARALTDALSAGTPGSPQHLAAYTRLVWERYGRLLREAQAVRRLAQRLNPSATRALATLGVLNSRSARAALEQRQADLSAATVVSTLGRALRHPSAALSLLGAAARGR